MSMVLSPEVEAEQFKTEVKNWIRLYPNNALLAWRNLWVNFECGSYNEVKLKSDLRDAVGSRREVVERLIHQLDNWASEVYGTRQQLWKKELIAYLTGQESLGSCTPFKSKNASRVKKKLFQRRF